MKTLSAATTAFTLDYTGPILSLNEYKSKTWQTLRLKVKQVEIHFTAALLQARPPRLLWMQLTVRHNTALDTDNVTGMIKPCVDVLRLHKILPDDNRRAWEHLTVLFDATLPTKNTVRFEVVGEALPVISKPVKFPVPL